MSDPIGTPPTFADGWDKKSWREDAAHENGEYICRCAYCLETFIGHKRRVVCRACSIEAMRIEIKTLRARVQELQDKNARIHCIADALLDNYDWWSVDEVDRARIWVDDIEELRDALRGGAR